MSKQTLLLALIAILFTQTVNVAHADENKPQKDHPKQVYIDQEMITLGLYLHGLNQELGRKLVRQDELSFLANQILKTAENLKDIKGDTLFHNNLNDLMQQAERVKKLSMSDIDKAKKAAHDLKAACARCHHGNPN